MHWLARVAWLGVVRVSAQYLGIGGAKMISLWRRDDRAPWWGAPVGHARLGSVNRCERGGGR